MGNNKCYNLANVTDLERAVFSHTDSTCVFISHKKEDEEAAKAIGNYLTENVGVSIYLDTEDCVLQEAVSTENDRKIVESIQKGLSCSTHLLCLISDKTKLSWWVPYEIGYADKQQINVAVLKLKDVEDVPSYVKIKNTLINIEEFLRYASELGPYGGIFHKEDFARLSGNNNELLFKYID